MDVVQMETAHPKQFDDSPLDRIPTSWEFTNLGNSFDEWYRYPTYYGIEYVESGIPEVRGELIKADGTIDENAGNFRYISNETANRFQRVRLEPDDFVMTVRGTMGKIAMVPERLRGAVITANLIRMKFTKSMVVPGWARHFLRSEFFQDALDLATSATTIKTIQVPELCAITFWRPPTKEQHRIAEILDTIDEAIQKTEELISKLKAMKQGLLHDLLTRGLDKNGKPRDPKAHPERFKDSPLGRIPKEWEVDKLEEVCRRSGGSVQTGPFGSQLHASDYKDSGTPIITVEHLGDSEIIHNNLPLVGRMDYERLVRYRLETGDLVFSRVGAIDRCAYVSEQENGWLFSGRCLRVRTGGKSVNSRFLSFQLNSYESRQWILNHSVGSTMACLNTSILSEVPVSLPLIHEQENIALLLDTHDARIRTEEQYRDKLKLQKKGLMHDLLTGKVKVKA